MTFVLDHDVPEAIARVTAQAGHSAEECRRFLRLLRQAGESGLSNNLNFAQCLAQRVECGCPRDRFQVGESGSSLPGLILGQHSASKRQLL